MDPRWIILLGVAGLLLLMLLPAVKRVLGFGPRRPRRKRRFTIRALMVVIAVAALDFAGFAWIDRSLRPPPVSVLILVIYGPILFLLVLIDRYVPPKLDRVLTVALILAVLAAIILPSLLHS